MAPCYFFFFTGLAMVVITPSLPVCLILAVCSSHELGTVAALLGAVSPMSSPKCGTQQAFRKRGGNELGRPGYSGPQSGSLPKLQASPVDTQPLHGSCLLLVPLQHWSHAHLGPCSFKPPLLPTGSPASWPSLMLFHTVPLSLEPGWSQVVLACSG